MVTIKEIEERIVELHRQGKTSKEISKDVHKNYNFIGDVIRKRFPEEYPDTITMTKETQALKAFHAKKSPTEVAIELGLSTDETIKFYKNFWRLEKLHELHRIYDEHRSNLRAFLRFFNQLKNRKITSRKDFDDILKIVDTNNALAEELEDIPPPNFSPKLLRGKFPNRVFDPIDKQISRQNDEAILPDNHIYSTDELEQAFEER
jgi:hypothetical protein